MAEVKKINVGPAITMPLALARRGGQIANEHFQKHSVAAKFSAVKDHPKIAMITDKADMMWTILGLVLIFHGAQFKNLFLCTQVMMAFCYTRVKSSVVGLHNDIHTAYDKMSEDSKADAKAEAKPADKKLQQNEDAAAAKKLLKVVDSEKVSAAAFELFVSTMACHMVMQGGLAKVIVVTHALVKGSMERINTLLDFSGHEDVQQWTDILLSFVLYGFFAIMAVVLSPLALALSVAMCGAQLVTEHGLRVAEKMGKLPEGGAEAFGSSMKGLMLLGGFTAFGTLWQFWALMADSGMGWYFKMFYFPACIAEYMVSFF